MKYLAILLLAVFASACTRHEVRRALLSKSCPEDVTICADGESPEFTQKCCPTCKIERECLPIEDDNICERGELPSKDGCATCHRPPQFECSRDIPMCAEGTEPTMDAETKCPECFKPRETRPIPTTDCIDLLCDEPEPCPRGIRPEIQHGCCPTCKPIKCGLRDKQKCKADMASADFPICEAEPIFENCCYNCKKGERRCNSRDRREAACTKEGVPTCEDDQRPFVSGECCPVCIPERVKCNFKRVALTCDLEAIPDCEDDQVPNVIDCCPVCKKKRAREELNCDCTEDQVCIRKVGEGELKPDCRAKRELSVCVDISGDLAESLPVDIGESVVVEEMIGTAMRSYCFDKLPETDFDISSEECLDMAEKIEEGGDITVEEDEECGKKFTFKTASPRALRESIEEERVVDDQENIAQKSWTTSAEEEFDLLSEALSNYEDDEINIVVNDVEGEESSASSLFLTAPLLLTMLLP